MPRTAAKKTNGQRASQTQTNGMSSAYEMVDDAKKEARRMINSRTLRKNSPVIVGVAAGAAVGAAVGALLSNDEYREKISQFIADLTPDRQKMRDVMDRVMSEKGREAINQSVTNLKETVGLGGMASQDRTDGTRSRNDS
ncbi:MAG TPA: hypothetical protein VD999_01455 [Vitreimonas sp.]|nr:hypothetical protein [Vitreimonas sp.]